MLYSMRRRALRLSSRNRDGFASMRSVPTHLGSRLILALAQVNHVPEQTVRRPFDIADLDDHFGLDPMDPTKHERRTEAATAWGRYRERHFVDHQGLEPPP